MIVIWQRNKIGWREIMEPKQEQEGRAAIMGVKYNDQLGVTNELINLGDHRIIAVEAEGGIQRVKWEMI